MTITDSLPEGRVVLDGAKDYAGHICSSGTSGVAWVPGGQPRAPGRYSEAGLHLASAGWDLGPLRQGSSIVEARCRGFKDGYRRLPAWVATRSPGQAGGG
jgi:hypothetical protein